MICLIVTLFFGFARSDVFHLNKIIRKLQPPYYIYDHHNQEYIPVQNPAEHPIEFPSIHPPVIQIPLFPTQAPAQSRPPLTERPLPEIIINKNVPIDAYDYLDNKYIPPQPFADEPKDLMTNPIIPGNNYLPPNVKPQADSPSTSDHYLPPNLENDILVNDILNNSYYLPAVPPTIQSDDYEQIEHGYSLAAPRNPLEIKKPTGRQIETSDGLNQPLRLELNELRCLTGIPQGYFKAVLTVQSFISATPVIELDDKVINDQKCKIRLTKNRLIIDIDQRTFEKCGILDCGQQQLCLKLRFPQIQGMTALSDSILTLQCKIQEKVVTKTHAVHLGVSKENQARSAGTFAQGGTQQPYRTQISLYRQNIQGHISPLPPGATVQLGEELVLRAHVKAGDGWNHTRISDVYLQRLGKNGEVLNSANLITANGCVHPAMKPICPFPPIFEPPLGHRFTFRAVMFNGMKSGDEMIMSVKVLGCLQYSDCYVDKSMCDSGRKKRETNKSDYMSTDISKVSFRVEMPTIPIHHTKMQSSETNPYAVIGVAGTVAFIVLAMLIGLHIKQRNKIIY